MIQKIKSVVEFISMVQLLLGVVAPLKSIVEVMEDIFAGTSGMGAEKKKFALQAFEQTLDIVGKALKVEVPKETLVGYASSIIDLLVAVFNFAGRFRRGSDDEGKK